MKVILITENDELYSSLRRALKQLYSINIVRSAPNANYNDFPNTKNCIIVDSTMSDDLERIAMRLRLRKNINPIVILALKDKELRVADESIFLNIAPFELEDIKDIIEIAKPISTQAHIKLIVNWLAKESHDIRNMLGGPATRIKCKDLINEIFDSISSLIKPSKDAIRMKNSIVTMIDQPATDGRIIADNIRQLFENIERTLKKES